MLYRPYTGQKPCSNIHFTITFFVFNAVAPKKVRVEAEPGLVVNETQTLTLNCRAHSYPNLTSVTWMKTINGKTEPIQDVRETFSVKSASPSDSGLYSCTATNEVGSSNSQEVEIKVQCEYTSEHVMHHVYLVLNRTCET